MFFRLFNCQALLLSLRCYLAIIDVVPQTAGAALTVNFTLSAKSKRSSLLKLAKD
jgi:hypothetical protein